MLPAAAQIEVIEDLQTFLPRGEIKIGSSNRSVDTSSRGDAPDEVFLLSPALGADGERIEYS